MKKYIKKVWKKVNNRGHERITFMVIPHGEATIVSIQLSKFTIYFALFITISVLFASVVSMQLQENIRPEVDQLNDSNRTYYYEREQYVDKFKQLQKYQQKLKNKLRNQSPGFEHFSAIDSWFDITVNPQYKKADRYHLQTAEYGSVTSLLWSHQP